MEFLRQHMNFVPEQNRNQNPEIPYNSVASSFKAFQSLRPPEFKGTADPTGGEGVVKRDGEVF